jgi:mRNA-degrading endonuclease RelE of RelBE toxin-antitoxin system
LLLIYNLQGIPIYGILLMYHWDVKILKKAYRQLKKLPRFIQDIADEAVASLEKDGPQPLYWDVKKINANEYRLRLNYRYRMKYPVKENGLFIEVFYIGHRKDAYQ